MVSETEALRKYCKEHQGEIFDVGFLHSKAFGYLGDATFRKFVSRLAAEGILIPVGKGIYTIGEVDNLERVVINHYTYGLTGMPAGEYLFYKRGLSNKEPGTKEVFSNFICGGKTIGNIKVIECDISYLPAQQFCVLFMECLKYKKKQFVENLCGMPMDQIVPTLKTLKDYEIKKLIKNTNYSRQVYLQLAELLKVCDVSNETEGYIAEKWSLKSEKAK